MHIPSDIQTVKIILILHDLSEHYNISGNECLGKSIALPESELGTLATDTLTTTSCAGAGEFVSQRHLIMQGCVWAAGTEIKSGVHHLQGGQVQLRARVT